SRQLQRKPLQGRPGVQCGEHLSISHADLDALFGRAWPKHMPHWRYHERVDWEHLGNPAVLINAIVMMVAVGVFVAVALLGSFAVYDGFYTVFVEGGGGLILTVLVGVCVIGTLLTKYVLSPDKRNFWLNRRTGLVSLPRRGRMVELPFDEFDPYLMPFTGYMGRTSYQLVLIHRYSDQHLIYPEEGESPWEVEAF
ncbi:hypothetical protein, partial [Alkalilimnicola ehrlichii]